MDKERNNEKQKKINKWTVGEKYIDGKSRKTHCCK